tara:strand:+ start:436 stop:705 length:270 start_codon:yes stop_codon:yes gene_type:complete
MVGFLQLFIDFYDVFWLIDIVKFFRLGYSPKSGFINFRFLQFLHFQNGLYLLQFIISVVDEFNSYFLLPQKIIWVFRKIVLFPALTNLY